MNQTVVELAMSPIAQIRRDGDGVFIDIGADYLSGLKGLDNFSHLQVFWWFSEFDGEEFRETVNVDAPYPGAPKKLGVFACRSPVRPNPLALTTVEILELNVRKGWIKIRDIEAYDETPVVDLKPYIPVCDRVKDVQVPAWFADWPAWLPKEGMGLDD